MNPGSTRKMLMMFIRIRWIRLSIWCLAPSYHLQFSIFYMLIIPKKVLLIPRNFWCLVLIHLFRILR